jgi:O-antigen/teichoic acid export membrane protein
MSLRNKAAKGIVWSATDKFTGQAGAFIFGIILARLLMPADYGLVAMLTLFITVSQTFIDSGLGSGLIQKKNRNEIDFTTVFVFNLTASIFFYFVLFITAPVIAEFYRMPQLVSLTRIIALNLVISSLTIVPYSKLTINIDFKTLAKINILSVFISGTIAVFFAFIGFGVWALVIRTISGTCVSVIAAWIFARWTPALSFSKKSFRELYAFGSRLLIAGLVGQVFQNIYNLVIGRVYSAKDLGYYERGKGFAELTSGTVTSILFQVTFPILASIREDKEKMISVYSRILKMTAFFIFPVMTLLALVSEPLIKLLLTDKWLPAAVLLQWMCFARIITPISTINMSILNAVGRSDLFLKVDLSKLPLAVIALVITIPLGIEAMVIGHVITSGISFFINAYMPGRLFGYGPIKQLKEISRVLISTVLMAIAVYFTQQIAEPPILKLLLGFVSGVGSYLLFSHFLKIGELTEIRTTITQVVRAGKDHITGR